jgi:hypothetical protein
MIFVCFGNYHLLCSVLDKIICRIEEIERKAANGSQRGEQWQIIMVKKGWLLLQVVYPKKVVLL